MTKNFLCGFLQPGKKNLVFLLVFVFITGGVLTDHFVRKPRMTELGYDALGHIAMSVQNTGYFPHLKNDFVLKHGDITDFYPSLTRNILLFIIAESGGDLYAPYLWIPAFTFAIFAFLMYFVVYKVSGNHFVALIITGASFFERSSFGSFGMLPLEVFAAHFKSVFFCFTPLLFFLLINYRNNAYVVMATFLMAGILTNFHSQSGFVFIQAVFLAHLLTARNKGKALAACLAGAALAAAAVAATSWGAISGGGRVEGYDPVFYAEMLRKYFKIGVYSASLRAVPVWSRIAFDTSVLLITACLFRRARKTDEQVDTFRFLITFAVIAFVFPLLESFLIFAVIPLAGRPLPVVDPNRGGVFYLIPLFLTAAMYLSKLAVEKKYFPLLFFSLLIFFVNHGTLVSTVRPFAARAYHGLRGHDWYFELMDDRKREGENLPGLIEWVRGNTGGDCVFAFIGQHQPKFRLFAERAVVWMHKDSGILIYANRFDLLREWDKRTDAITPMLENATPEIVGISQKYGADYLVVHKANQNGEYSVPKVYDDGFYRVYKLPFIAGSSHCER